MRAVRIEKPGDIRIVRVDKPRPGPGEVLVRIMAVGLCGTDLHLFQGIFGEFPIIPGHDAAGVIEEVGRGVDHGRIGSRVTLDPAGCCLRSAEPVPLCPECGKGWTNLCQQATYMGMSSPGAMAEYVVIPSARAVDLPDSISDKAATILEPVVVGLHLLEQIADREGDVLVIGAGPIGLTAGLMLKAQGRDVSLSEPLAARRNLARELGLEDVLEPRDIDEFHPAGLIVETSGHSSSSETMVKAARPGSTILLVGGATDIPGLIILTRELEVRAVKGGRGLYPEALEWVAENGLDLDSLVSHDYPAAEAERAFSATIAKPNKIFRSVLDMTRW